MNELKIIKKAVKFEIEAIKNNDTTPNPYYTDIINMENGSAIWEMVNGAVELHFENGRGETCLQL